MQKNRKTNFHAKLAISLLVFSFVPYGLMLSLPYFSLSLKENAICVTACIVSAEVIQWIAILLVGKQLFAKYRKRLMPLKWIKRKNKLENNDVYVFKTTVLSETDILIVKPHLDNLLQGHKWNFDLDDCDNILRIESKSDITPALIKILREHNYQCEELK